jgi:hypothetical protein
LLRSVRALWEHVFDDFGQGRPQSTGDLADALLSVGEAKLGIQAATSIGYDTQALGLMAVALAGVNNVVVIGQLTGSVSTAERVVEREQPSP